ncbi:MAG: PHP domain-containing protein [Christensenellales bacterium]
MAFWGDYHTHTVYSHGKGTIEENVLRAVRLGMKEIAITDHGFRHMTYNVRRMDWKIMREEVDFLKIKYPSIKVYLGLETNLSSRRGKADILPTDMSILDIVVCGYHKFVLPDRLSDFGMFFLPNFIWGNTEKCSAKLIKRNTDAYIKLLEKYDIDIVSHINYGIKADAAEVARACRHFGTYVELNGKRISMTDKELAVIASEGTEFICDSDAHSINRVGDFSVPVAAVERVGIPYSQIANWERLPRFRSRIKKGLYDNASASDKP